MILSKYKDLAYKAYSGISYYPDKRAEQIIAEYSQELEEDAKNIYGV